VAVAGGDFALLHDLHVAEERIGNRVLAVEARVAVDQDAALGLLGALAEADAQARVGHLVDQRPEVGPLPDIRNRRRGRLRRLVGPRLELRRIPPPAFDQVELVNLLRVLLLAPFQGFQGLRHLLHRAHRPPPLFGPRP
jgi:hypothetical protein